jgi:hypothetical protein
MYNSGDDSTWYMGVPYGVSDQWMVGRRANVSFSNAAADDGYAYLMITEAGRVGIGTATPGLKLHVYTTASTDGILLDGSTHPAITLQGAGTTRGYIGVATGSGAFVNNSVTGDLILRSNSTKLHLATSQTAASMTFSGTNVGIGTTAPAGRLHVSSGTSGDCELIIGADTDNNDENDNPRLIFMQDGALEESAICQKNNYLDIMNSVSSGGIYFSTGTSTGYTNATARLVITGAGLIIPQSLADVSGHTVNVNTLYGYLQKDTSSIRTKNLASETVASQMSLDTIDALEPKVFAYKAAPDLPHIGLIAEEAYDVNPYLVIRGFDDEDNPRPEAMLWPAVTSLLIETVKDLRTRIAVLEDA